VIRVQERPLRGASVADLAFPIPETIDGVTSGEWVTEEQLQEALRRTRERYRAAGHAHVEAGVELAAEIAG
jgi:hypothetical protein